MVPKCGVVSHKVSLFLLLSFVFVQDFSSTVALSAVMRLIQMNFSKETQMKNYLQF